MNARLTRPTLTLFLLTGLLPGPLVGQQEIRLGIQAREFKRIKIAIPPLKAPAEAGEGVEVAEQARAIVRQDLDFSLRFELVSLPEGDWGQGGGSSGGSPVEYGRWALWGTENLVLGEVRAYGGNWEIEARLYDVTFRNLIRTVTVSASLAGLREAVHRLSDDIVRTLTGEEGVATTKIACVRVVGRAKEVEVMDYDGENRRSLTQNGSLNLNPTWSPEGRWVTFTSYLQGNPDLYSVDLREGKLSLFSARRGLNTAPAWSPDGKRVALTLSKDGDPEIYLLEASSGKLRRLTYHQGIDTSPAWSPNGREIAFMSDRSGYPHLYIMDEDGSNVRRLTFDGTFNDLPAWSPQGDKIAYVSRVDGKFQIWLIEITGERAVQLTAQGNNEDPSWSPDGLHLVFASDRLGSYQIYTMSWDGSRVTQVTRDGSYTSPSWSPRIRTTP